MKALRKYGGYAASTLLCALALAGCGGNSSNNDSSSTASSSSSSVAVAATPISCPATSTTLYFCDDFQNGKSDNWDLTPNGSDASFAVVDATDVNGATTKALQYTAGTLSVLSAASSGVVALIKDTVWAAKVGTKGDYYVEMRIQPQTNSTTGNKQLYMIGRYKDNSNWNLGGLNVQNSTGSTQVEAGYTVSGSINRAFQSKKPISNGSWYTVRLEMIGTKLTMYLDGDKVYMGSADSITDSTSGFTSGKIGLFTYNKSFLIDDVKVGDPSVKPTQLSLSTSATTYIAEAGDAALPITVTALKTDSSADTFTVTSSNPSVVSAVVSGTTVTLTPLTAGSSTIKFVSGSDPTVVKTITATISPKYVDSTTTYTLTGKVLPAVGETAAYTDDKLQLTFDSTPTLGTSGTIRIFKKSDDSLVDKLQLSGETDSIGTGAKQRGVNTTPIQISGNTVTITPHSGKLAAGTTYYVGISSTAFTGATLAGTAFNGIGKAANWSFTTKASTPAAGLASVSVAATGTTADFRTVQSALNYYMTNTSVANPVINVANGTYNELLYLNSRANVTIKGESRTGVIIQYNNYDTLNSGGGSGAASATSGGGRGVFLAEDSDLLTLDTLTLKNTHTRSSLYSNQAETIMYKSSNNTHRLVAKNADFYSEQDTIYVTGYSWFYNTRISGNVDFIWGQNNIALFENSVIEMIGDSQYPATTSGYANGTGGYYLQARVNAGAKGFVFLNSTLTNADGPTGVKVATGANAASYLARAASGSWEDNIAFINCRMDTHIASAGWAANVAGNPNPNPSTATATKGWREYNSMTLGGVPLDVSGRSTTSKQLTAAEVTSADLGDRASVFKPIGWTPEP
ncbi:hypothetical protein [Uliginosibacterium sediminicola]|uniref:Pectin methylesterase n=1 Tax=Uliginosibacterium sediminicola TaxID=2024550 RepID=A0ABU9YXV9_9RHOO